MRILMRMRMQMLMLMLMRIRTRILTHMLTRTMRPVDVGGGACAHRASSKAVKV